jgi:glutamyl-tRNA synthetase
LLRIEDTDQKRFITGAEKYIIDSLTWLGILPDDSINPDGTAKYRQSEREYRSYVEILLKNGNAYYAFDTAEELDAMRKRLEAGGVSNPGYTTITRENMRNSLTLSADEVTKLLESNTPYVIRFNTPRHKEVRFTDSVKGVISFNSNNMDDKILFKSDGLPTYHMANVVDDHLMEITHVIRGDEWLSSTPLHILLYEAFGWDRPEFCHLPLILGPDKKKLSKRHGDKYGFPVFPITWDYVNEDNENVHVTGFKDGNYEPDALINFLALLGWNPGENKEIMTMAEMISMFDLERINNSGAMFDIEKLKNFNAHYLRSRDNGALFVEYIYPSIPINRLKPTDIDKVVEIAKERSVFHTDLYPSVSYFFEPVVLKDDVVLKNPTEFSAVMESVLKSDYSEGWDAVTIKKDLEAFCELFGFKLGKILPDLRTALTGGIPGPDLPTTMSVLGKEESLSRIKNLLNKIEKVAN